jgi:hypothetical protein
MRSCIPAKVHVHVQSSSVRNPSLQAPVKSRLTMKLSWLGIDTCLDAISDQPRVLPIGLPYVPNRTCLFPALNKFLT